MALPATDAFTRADGALGANWTGSVGSDLSISSNAVTGAAATDSAMYWTTDTPNNDQRAKCTLTTTSAGQYAGPFVRGNATDFVVLVAQSNTDYQIQWYNGGAWTQIGSTYAVAPANGDVLEIKVEGTTFKGFINGVERISGTNGSAPASGNGGLYVYNNSARVDDFEVDNLATVEQEGFRFGVDDANEASHTWEAAQDTNISTAAGVTKLIRQLLNTTGDKAATAFKLKFQKNGSGGYATVPIGAATSPTLAWGAAGTIAYSASGGASVAPTYPAGITVNSALILVVGQKPSSANGGTATTPTGWTLQGSLTGANDGDTGGYTTTLGADTGNTNIFVYTKDAVSGSESGTLSVTVGTNGVCWANIYRIEASATCTWSYACGVGKDTSAGNVSIATGSMSITAGDHILAGMVIPTDVTTPAQFSAEALAQTGTTFGAVSEVEEPDSGTGNDIGGFLCQAGVSSGSGSGAVTLTATAGGTTTNVRGPGFVLRVRCAAVNNDIYITTSANITAGGEATTARLTAPSGKSTSDFVTGRRWDDENGTDTIDITTDDYTEVEWCLTLRSGLTGGDYFDFRVYNGDVALDTYTVTPRWTIVSSITGIGLATQASDAPTSTATLKLAAVVSQTQANNTSTATGALDIVGILTQTQASDSIVATGTGTTTTTGTGLITQADNTIASTATLNIQAVANQTQANNVIASTGALSLAANVTQSQADNTATSTAALSIKATATQVQADNTLSSTAALDIKASTNQIQADNVPSTTGTLSIVANVNQTQADNVSTATGALYIYANTTATQDSNTITTAGAGTPSTNGVVAATQDSNTINASARLDIVANGLVTQADNAPSITATLALFGAVGVTADDNTATIAGALDIQGAVNVSQGGNVLIAYNVTPIPDRDVTPNLAYYKAVRAEQKRDLAMYMDRYYG